MIGHRRTAFIDHSSPQPMPKPIPHDPSLRVPSPRFIQTASPAPPAEAGGILLPAALVRATLQPFQFVLNQLWTAALPLVDLLGLPIVAPTGMLGAPDHLDTHTSADSAPAPPSLP